MKRYFSVSGRYGRNEFVNSILLTLGMAFLIYLLCAGIFAVLRQGKGWLTPSDLAISYGLAFLVCLLLGVLQVIKRLHDLDRNAWEWILLGLPIYNLYVLYLLIFVEGKPGGGRFGSNSTEDAATREQWHQQVTPGMSEQEVRDKLGEPFKVYAKETAPESYYLPSYPQKVRDITGKVLVYLRGASICYVWTDTNECVEEVFTG